MFWDFLGNLGTHDSLHSQVYQELLKVEACCAMRCHESRVFREPSCRVKTVATRLLVKPRIRLNNSSMFRHLASRNEHADSERVLAGLATSSQLCHHQGTKLQSAWAWTVVKLLLQAQQMQQMHDHGSVRTDFCIHVAPVAYYTMYLYNIISICSFCV